MNEALAVQMPNAKFSIGGQVGHGFALTEVSYLKISTGERWILSLGDRFGKNNQSNPPYFHVEHKNGKLLFIDLAQTMTSHISIDQINMKIKNSEFLKTIDMTTDPIDQNMNLRLQLKKEVSIKVYQVRGQTQTSKIVIDLTPSEAFR